MENTGEITLEEALRMLAAAKLQIEEQQQLLKSKEDVILEKELKIEFIEAVRGDYYNTFDPMAYCF